MCPGVEHSPGLFARIDTTGRLVLAMPRAAHVAADGSQFLGIVEALTWPCLLIECDGNVGCC